MKTNRLVETLRSSWANPRVLRRAGIATVSGLLLLGIAIAAEGRIDGRIAEGDYAEVFTSAFRESDGALVWTNDAERARVALAEGNPYLNPNLTAFGYGPTRGYVRLTDDSASLSRFILGHQQGDIVKTPPLKDVMGTSKTYILPADIGPLDTVVRVNLSQAYHPKTAGETQQTLGPRDAIRVGDRVPYAGIMEATVVELTEEEALLAVDFTTNPEARLFSKVLGLNVTVEHLPTGQVMLHPDAAVGERFETRGCKLPQEIVPTGQYRVEAVDGDGIHIRTAPWYKEHVLDETLVFEYQILKVDKWPELRRAQTWAAAHLTPWTG